MKVTLESTAAIVNVDGIEGRIWKGTTERGIACQALIARFAVDHALDASEFQDALTEVAAPVVRSADDAVLESRWLAYADAHGRTPMDIRADSVIWYAVLAQLHLALKHAGNRFDHAGGIARAFMRQTIARLTEDDPEGGALLHEMFGDVL